MEPPGVRFKPWRHYLLVLYFVGIIQIPLSVYSSLFAILFWTWGTDSWILLMSSLAIQLLVGSGQWEARAGGEGVKILFSQFPSHQFAVVGTHLY